MNTLSREITSPIFPNPQSYIQLQQHWSQLMCSERKHELSAAHHLLYLALMGKNWQRGFTPLTNQRRLANGAFWNWQLLKAMTLFHSTVHEVWLLAPFDGFVTVAMLHAIRPFVPTRREIVLKCEEFVDGRYPIPAYILE